MPSPVKGHWITTKSGARVFITDKRGTVVVTDNQAWYGVTGTNQHGHEVSMGPWRGRARAEREKAQLESYGLQNARIVKMRAQ